MMELSALREKLNEARGKNDKQTAEQLATRILQISSLLHQFNRKSWYSR